MNREESATYAKTFKMSDDVSLKNTMRFLYVWLCANEETQQ